MDPDTGEKKWLTYRQAAVRVNHSVRSMWRWRAEGMPMIHGIREGQLVRLVDEDVLLEWWRAKMKASPVHYYRMRARARAAGLADPVPPASIARRGAV